MLVKYSALVSDMSGKLNGSVASRNRGGQYLRNKTTPLNPQTAQQVQVRNQFGIISGSWRALTDNDRASWNDSAVNFPYTNVFGDVKYLSGFNLHQQLNTNLRLIGRPVLVNAPVPQEVPTVTVTVPLIDVSDEIMNANIMRSGIDVNGRVLIYATPGMSAGISYMKNRFRLIGHSNTTGVQNIWGMYVAEFGIPAVGTRIFIRVAGVRGDTGQVSPAVQSSGTVVA